MLDFVYGRSTVAQAVLIVAIMIAASLAGLMLSRTVADPDKWQVHREVAGFIYATMGVLYAVLLAFAAVAVWEDTNKAVETLHLEENAIADLYREVGLLPAPFSTKVREHAKAYVTTLVDDEWPRMRHGQRSDKATELLRTLFADFGEIKLTTKHDELVYAEAFQQLKLVLDYRRLRLFEAGNGLQRVVWYVLILGAAITIGFTYLFALRSLAVQAIITGTLSASIGLIFFLIVALDYPFRGDIAMPADRLRSLLQAWQSLGI